MAKKSHPDVEFQVLDRTGKEVYLKTLDEAALHAFYDSLSTGKWTGIYVIVRSEAGARWYGGDAAIEQYRSDPEASVFEKLNLNVRSEGTIA